MFVNIFFYAFVFVGPKTETLEDHWRMIWEQKTATIIMLARCFEDGGVWEIN